MRVGIVGAGWVTQYHLPAWRRLPDVELHAICDPNSEALGQRADAFSIPNRYPTLEAMLNADCVDVLDIASPRRFHAEHVRAAAARGLPTLCQKPIATTLAEAESLRNEINDHVPLMVHENWRFRPYYRTLRRWLEAGLVGGITSIRLDYHSSGMIASDDGARHALQRQPFFRHEKRLLVMEVLIHHLDTLRYLFGELELIQAHLKSSTTDIAGEDSAILTLVTREGNVPLAVSGNLAAHGAGRDATDQLWIWGSQGTIHFDGSVLRLLGTAPQEIEFNPVLSYQAAYDSAIDHFVTCLKRDLRFETALDDNIETLRLVEAAYQKSGFEK